MYWLDIMISMVNLEAPTRCGKGDKLNPKLIDIGKNVDDRGFLDVIEFNENKQELMIFISIYYIINIFLYIL